MFFMAYAVSVKASQMAIVTSDQAIVYSDRQMSSAVGFIPKGKKIKVGEVARNNAQVYPIIISGKIAYIRVLDVSTEKESVESKVLVAERFKGVVENGYDRRYVLSYLSYASQINVGTEDSGLENKSTLNWNGVSLRGDVKLNPRWDLQIMGNFLMAKQNEAEFKAFEIGAGPAFRIFSLGKFILRWDAQVLLVPFASFAYREDFRVNGYGFGAGTGLNLNFQLNNNWGLEVFGGLTYVKLTGFNVPNPFEKIDPTFYGNRFGAGANYQF